MLAMEPTLNTFKIVAVLSYSLTLGDPLYHFFSYADLLLVQKLKAYGLTQCQTDVILPFLLGEKRPA